MKLWYPALALMAATACNNDIAGLGPASDPATETFAPSLNVNIAQMTKLPNGVYIQDITVGTGDEIVAKTDTAWANYARFLKDGRLIDSGNNTKFELPGLLIPGFSTGMVGMKVGGERLIVIPSEQGYGHVTQRNPSTGKITIPRQSTLVFRITLLKLHTPTTGTGTTA